MQTERDEIITLLFQVYPFKHFRNVTLHYTYVEKESLTRALHVTADESISRDV